MSSFVRRYYKYVKSEKRGVDTNVFPFIHAKSELSHLTDTYRGIRVALSEYHSVFTDKKVTADQNKVKQIFYLFFLKMINSW